MGGMASAPVEQIKEKLDIVEFLKGYLSVQTSGKNFKGLCPFHKEKTPSFMISPERQNWHCFGCGLGGDVFTFLMKYENLEFAEALKVLAERAGVELRKVSPADYKFFGLLYDLNEAAKEFYKKELANSELARKYLLGRGLKPETIEEFELGFAPNLPDSLNLYFINSGHSPEDIVRAGLAIKSDRGGQFDRFRGRIMFPIKNNQGKTVGFTGRILAEFDPGNVGKYVNSPETPIFNKSKLLYGFHKSKDFIREEKRVFLMEGQTDFLMSWQSGVKNVVASSGTALTPDHLQALKRLTDEIILTFDNDEAGLNAGERAIDLAEAFDYNVKVVLFKDYKDAAEAAAKNPEDLIKALGEARPATEFYFERYLPKKSADYGNRENLKGLRTVLVKIRNIASPVSKSSWLKELSRRTGVSEKTLTEETEKLAYSKTENQYSVPAEEIRLAENRKLSRHDLICERLISAALEKNNFELVERNFSRLTTPYKKIFELLKSGERKSGDPNLDKLLNLIILRSEALDPKEIEELEIHLAKEHLKERRYEISLKVKKAEAEKNEIELNSALEELHNLSRLS